MKRREVEAALRAIGAKVLRDRGDHTVWGYLCGEHIAPDPRHGDITAGVVGSIQKQIACAPKGWLQ
jgi:predicted RNA binding protein YcfA (HicA-like mRNA interferase family)